VHAHEAIAATRRPYPNRSTTRTFVVRELMLWAAVYPLYLAVRGWSIADPDHAFADAWRVIGWEHDADLLHEARVQQLLEPLRGFFSTYYMVGFGPIVASTLVWLALSRRELYVQLRTLLFIALAIALVVYVAFPTAPPRLVPGLGISDTVGLAGHDSGSFAGIRFDPYAAMPSLHVGWSLLAAIAIFRATSRTWLRVLAVLHPVLMALAVTATGNHYLLDSLAGAGVAALALLASSLVLRSSRATATARPAPAVASRRA
jgi:membrane-associated phospholipid phosphatase